MRTLLALFLLVALEAKPQNSKVDNFCQYLDQPIQKLLANLKSTIVDTVVTKTRSGTVRSFLLVFNDSSYFEIFPLLNKTTGVLSSKHIKFKAYLGYKIKCLFYHVPGDVVDNCGCRSLVQYRNERLEINYHEFSNWRIEATGGTRFLLASIRFVMRGCTQKWYRGCRILLFSICNPAQLCPPSLPLSATQKKLRSFGGRCNLAVIKKLRPSKL